MKIPFLDLKEQYLSIKDEIDTAIERTIMDSSFIQGKYVKLFEEEFAQFNESKFCQSTGNGTDALEIAIEALNLPEKSEIIVPAFTFVATSEAVTRSGHKVIFCDINPDTFCIDADLLEEKITNNTRAIIAVHLYGHPSDMKSILKIGEKYNLKIIEDCAQAHGTEIDSIKVGNFGDIATFSFYPGKNLGAYGDGGAIVTKNEHLAKKCKMIANHGRIDKYNHEFEGRSSRLDGLQAAILSVKLKYLNSWIKRKIKLANLYYNLLEEANITCCKPQPNYKHSYHLFVIKTSFRKKLIDALSQQNIATGIHYPIALPFLDAYKYLEHSVKDFPMAAMVQKQVLSLPIYPELREEQVAYICNIIKSV